MSTNRHFATGKDMPTVDIRFHESRLVAVATCRRQVDPHDKSTPATSRPPRQVELPRHATNFRQSKSHGTARNFDSRNPTARHNMPRNTVQSPSAHASRAVLTQHCLQCSKGELVIGLFHFILGEHNYVRAVSLSNQTTVSTPTDGNVLFIGLPGLPLVLFR